MSDDVKIPSGGTATGSNPQTFTVSVATPPKPAVTVTDVVVGPPGPPGPPGLNWRGAWVVGTAYVVSDAVTHVGSNAIASSYVCLIANTGQAPAEGASTTYWGLLAQEGATGATGATGPKGDKGDPGAPAGALNTSDTATIDLTGDGTAGAPLKADVIAGSYPIVPSNAGNVDFTGVGTTASPLSANVEPGTYPIVTNDTATVDFTGAGTTASPLKADVLPAGLPPSFPIYDECGSLTVWQNFGGTGTATVAQVADSAAGGNVIRVVGLRNPMVRMPLVPFDPTALYRVKFRVRQTVNPTAGGSDFYGGLEGVAADGVTPVNTSTGAADRTGSNWVGSLLSLTVANGWQELVGYIRGAAIPGFGPGIPSSISSPGKMHSNVRYVRPVLAVNYSAGNGTAEIDYVSLEIVPEPVTPLPLYDECGSLTPWAYPPSLGGGTVSVANVADSAAGGNVFRVVGQAGVVRTPLVPFDPNALYRVKFRIRQTVNPSSGGSQLWGGIEGIAADGVTQVNSTGAAGWSDQHFAVSGTAITVAGGWQEFIGYVKGSAATGTAGPCPNPSAPGKLHQNVRYIRPYLFINFNNGTGTAELDYVSLEIVSQVANTSGEVTLTGDGRAGNPLSAALTGVRNGNWNMTTGGVYLGDKASGNSQGLYIYRATTPSPMTGLVIISNSYGASGAVTLGFSTDDGAAATLYLNKDPQLGVGSGGVNRPIPFATWAGQGSVVIPSNASAGTVAVTLPAGRFTVAPLWACTVYGRSDYLAAVISSTTSSVTLGARHADNLQAANTIVVHANAMQMTPTSATG